MTDTIGTVAAAAEEMTASIAEIASTTADTARVAVEASQKASVTNDSITRLGESSAEIGEVVRLITS